MYVKYVNVILGEGFEIKMVDILEHMWNINSTIGYCKIPDDWENMKKNMVPSIWWSETESTPMFDRPFVCLVAFAWLKGAFHLHSGRKWAGWVNVAVPTTRWILVTPLKQSWNEVKTKPSVIPWNTGSSCIVLQGFPGCWMYNESFWFCRRIPNFGYNPSGFFRVGFFDAE